MGIGGTAAVASGVGVGVGVSGSWSGERVGVDVAVNYDDDGSGRHLLGHGRGRGGITLGTPSDGQAYEEPPCGSAIDAAPASMHSVKGGRLRNKEWSRAAANPARDIIGTASRKRLATQKRGGTAASVQQVQVQ